jgi:DNA primase
MDGRARLAELTRPLVKLIPDGVYKELLMDRLAGEIGMGRDTLTALLVGDTHATRPTARRTSRPNRVSAMRPSLARQAIKLILNYPSVCANLTRSPRLAEVRQRGVPLLVEMLEITKQRPDITSAGLLEKFRDRPEGPHLVALMTEEILVDEEAAATELADSLDRIVGDAEHQRLAELVDLANERSLNAAELDELRRLRRSDGEVN